MDRNVSKPEKSWETFHGPNLGYVMDMYEKYKNNPNDVEPDLREWFKNYGAPPSTQSTQPLDGHSDAESMKMSASTMHKISKAINLADNIRTFGHILADVNPIEEPSEESPLLKPEENGLSEDDLRSMPADLLCKDAPNHIEDGYDAIVHLKQMYTKSIAFEFDHVYDLEERNWLIKMVESGDIYEDLSNEKRQTILERLTATEKFEQYLHKNFVGQKRFSIEGLDSMVPMLEEMVQHFIHEGASNVMIGMAHRGRLSTLAHVLGKPYNLIFSEFKHAPNKETAPSEGSTTLNYGWTGDVKYHLGADMQVNKESNYTTVSIANNPSHLEFVDPVVAGYARAAQEDREKTGFPDVELNKAGAILVHGDAAFPGEGIVAETLNLSRLKGYQIGGTLHIIANNLLGFTTESHDSRSTTYASDLAKGFEIPIIHVNADDPDACIAAVILACEYRRRFHKDFLIDLVGYRRFGHNEMDEPAATQPQLYEQIRAHDTARTLYAEKLQQENVIDKDQAQAMIDEAQNTLEKEYEKVSGRSQTPGETEPPEVIEKGLPDVETAVDYSTLKQINEELLQYPEGFTVFPKLGRILQRREKAFTEGNIDWGHAEALAFASILSDGTPIRMTGQDSERGTFSHRHLILHDAENGDIHSPMHTLSTAKASFALHNSPLSEAAVVGFEYGYNVQAPDTLVLWEAQYGDFSNAAQVIYDQFISAGRAKWGQRSGLVLLLPHGYEGSGPEHSSARLERFLSLAAENNWNVANATNTSQYFHLLRRQAATLEMDEVRPLVLMTPKSLLRNQTISNSYEAFTEGKFQTIIEDPITGNNADDVDTLIFCSGKVSIDLHENIDENTNTDQLHIVRVEELYPYPRKEIEDVLSRYKNVTSVKWVQEEPKNMGAWGYIQPYLLETLPEGIDLQYIGRRRRSSPSEGDPNVHKREQQRIIDEALNREERGS
ncbi:2-oxoglutarate dehydrogenase E1 component [Geomicrobium halophilum]|uniref:2-oxoglutarate dehydrogenase E1 component n=1 Tax=Geomicrobium halophilum TaxID=549000 RepID=A0A841Q0R1_9BACL|nr:2-oxoglutarate dehydrogenase E1 component [Geomicrobium halophilum]MBB6449118.1 2-oxoglutarate dehydrogenase E1 component [Geomicrobium halophilum]